MEVGKEFMDLINKEEGTENQDGQNADNGSGADDDNNGGENTNSGDNTDLETGNAADNQQQASIEGTEEYTEDFQKKVMDFITKKSGKTYESVDDLWKNPDPVTVEVEKVVEKNPYEKIDPKVKGFLDYHTETGRGFEDYQKLNQDISAISDIDLARERVLADTGMDLSPEEIDAYLEKQLNIDLSDVSDLDKSDIIALSAFTKSFREQKKQEQEKYKQPVTNQPNPQDDADMVTLEDGKKMPKAVYDDLLLKRNQYLEDVQKATDSITASNFQVKFDDKGTEKTLDFNYEYSADDKHNMVSMSKDVNQTIGELFRTENGFDHKGFVEAMNWINPKTREKMVSTLIHKAIAQTTESVMKEIDNVNLGSQNNLPGSKAKKTVPLPDNNSGFGVKFSV